MAVRSKEAKRPARSVVPRIRLLQQKSQLRGTCYFELLPGAYQGECWTDRSVFLSEEAFGYLEPIFKRHAPGFDHYAFQAVSRLTWQKILAALRALAKTLDGARTISDLDSHVGFLYRDSRERISRGFRRNVKDLSRLCRDLIAWLEAELKVHRVISVLGI